MTNEMTGAEGRERRAARPAGWPAEIVETANNLVAWTRQGMVGGHAGQRGGGSAPLNDPLPCVDDELALD